MGVAYAWLRTRIPRCCRADTSQCAGRAQTLQVFAQCVGRRCQPAFLLSSLDAVHRGIAVIDRDVPKAAIRLVFVSNRE